MSSLSDRRSSPRRSRPRPPNYLALRVVFGFYSAAMLFAFVFTGDPVTLILTLIMLHITFQPPRSRHEHP